MLATVTSDLDKIAPRFEVQPEQIEILKTPSEFYETLKVGLTCLAILKGYLLPNIQNPCVHQSVAQILIDILEMSFRDNCHSLKHKSAS
jgi:hypothetical protein